MPDERPGRLDIAIHTLGLPITGEDPVDLSLGGSETAVVAMARALAALGHEVTVLCRTEEERTVAGVSYLPAERLDAWNRERVPDLLLSSRHHEVLCRPLRARMLGMWHHDMPTGQLAGEQRAALSKASFSFFLSRFHLAEHEKTLRGLAPSARLTTNGVDFPAADAVREAAGGPAAPPRFLYASRPERALAALLRDVWPKLRERLPKAELEVACYSLGNVTFPEATQRHYDYCDALLEQAPGVRKLGSLARRELWRRMAGCRAVLYPTSFPEISCMVALEAQALGVPIVATAAFALEETVGFRDTLIEGPPDSAAYLETFVERTARLVEDEAFFEKARSAGLEHVCAETHSWNAVARKWTETFEGLFEERFRAGKPGVLRRLLREGDLEGAGLLVRHAAKQEEVFDAADLRAVEARGGAETGDLPPLPARILRTPPLPKVSATLLVKDEEANLRRAVESFEGVADEILLGDTGSSDRTLEIAAELGFGEDGPRRIVPIEFRDFAQARNELASHATGDWIYWQDADEILVHGAKLREWVDANVFFDAFTVEQRHLVADSSLPSDHPVRCFRPASTDGPLLWVGAIHELIEHGGNRIPDRAEAVPGVYVAHLGYLFEEQRYGKAAGRNFPLLVEDRRQNPERSMGYVLGMREYLNLARWEVQRGGRMTRKAYRCLNLGWEIWHQHIRHFPRRFRDPGYRVSRQILEALAHCGLKLERTGEVPFQADVSFAAQRGRLHVDGRDIGREREHYASVEELREELETRLDRLDADLGRTIGSELPLDAPERAEGLTELELDPRLFGLDSDPE